MGASLPPKKAGVRMALPGRSPVLAALRLIAAVTVPPCLLLANFARRSPSIFTLGATLAAFVVFVGTQVGGLQPNAIGWAGLVATVIMAFVTYRDVAHGGLQLAASFVAIAALALDWIAFDWYLAIPLVLVAASIGLGLAERRARTA